MKIQDTSGVEHDINCIACAIQSGQVALPVERIAETEYFVAEQDLEHPIEGFVIIASKRHIKSFTELSAEEQKDMMALLVACRNVMRTELGIHEVTLIQEEGGATSSSHFHIWLFPWLPWMDERGYAHKVQNVILIMKEAKGAPRTPEQEQRLTEAAAKLKKALSS
ncbi:MAG TPA: HIT domain-containing protein [Candidatus Paceibacterota bacterium]